MLPHPWSIGDNLTWYWHGKGEEQSCKTESVTCGTWCHFPGRKCQNWVEFEGNGWWYRIAWCLKTKFWCQKWSSVVLYIEYYRYRGHSSRGCATLIVCVCLFNSFFLMTISLGAIKIILLYWKLRKLCYKHLQSCDWPLDVTSATAAQGVLRARRNGTW